MPTPLKILFVDDDVYIRKVLGDFLQRSGFVVLSAADGEDALETAKAYDGKIDILVSDLIMPGMSGIELAKALVRSRPELKVLLISAFADGPPPLDPLWGFLRKPFAPTVLSDKIKEMCTAEPARAPKELLCHRMREARAQYIRYSQEFDLLIAVSGDLSRASQERKLALREAAQVRKSTLHAYADAVRQFGEFLRAKQKPETARATH